MTLLRMLATLGVAVAAEPAVAGLEAGKVVNSTLRGSEPRHLASCGVAGRVDCGVCKCTDPVACSWCDGNGGPARITGGSGGSAAPANSGYSSGNWCPSNLVSCGVCTCTTRSACQYCDGYGGPARITSASHRGSAFFAALLTLPLVWQ
mmetsp:Transcript_118606/g.166766  ORF Transcript_118606/g.166766 Transcript_118606/m.166766 type:complete len:149 (-) Transcript_118606:67-513(-)